MPPEIDINLILWNSLLGLIKQPGFSGAFFEQFSEMEPFREFLPNLARKLEPIVKVLQPRREDVVAWIGEWVEQNEEAGSLVTEIWNRKFPPKPAVPVIEPSLLQKAKNLAGAAGRVVGAMLRDERVRVDEQEKSRRLEICRGCEFFNSDKGVCMKCGCIVKFKTVLATEHCPLPVPKW